MNAGAGRLASGLAIICGGGGGAVDVDACGGMEPAMPGLLLLSRRRPSSMELASVELGGEGGECE